MITAHELLEFQLTHYAEMLEEAKLDKSEKGFKRKWFLYKELVRLKARKKELND